MLVFCGPNANVTVHAAGSTRYYGRSDANFTVAPATAALHAAALHCTLDIRIAGHARYGSSVLLLAIGAASSSSYYASTSMSELDVGIYNTGSDDAALPAPALRYAQRTPSV